MKKLLKALLVFSMILTLVIMPVSATNNTPNYYVVLGDSIGAGFNLDGTDSQITSNVKKNYKNDASICYGNIIAHDLLKVQGYTKDIYKYYSNISCAAATIGDIIQYIQNPEYYVEGLSYFGTQPEDMKFHDIYIEEISKADTLVLHCGNNDLMVNAITDLTSGAIGDNPIYTTYNGLEVIDNVDNPIVVMLFQSILNGLNEDWSVNSEKMTQYLTTYYNFYNSDESISKITIIDVYRTISYFKEDNLSSMLVELAQNGAKDYQKLIKEIKKLNEDVDLYVVGYFNPFPASEEETNLVSELMKVVFSGGEISSSLVGNLVGDALQIAIDEFNTLVKAMCKKQNIDYIDITNVPLSGKLDPHPDATGHQYIASQIEDTIIQNVTTEVVGNGKATIKGAKQAIKNSEVTYSLNVEEGSELEKVVVNGKEVEVSNNVITITVTTDTTITVYVAKHEYTTVNATGDHVSIVGEMNPEIGSTQTYTMQVEEGYEIAQVLVNGKEVAVENSSIVVEVSKDMSIEVITQIKFPFKDVSKDKWYYSYIQEVYQLGIMTGTSETTFKPSANITRGQLATILYRMAESPAVNNTESFVDVASNKFYTNAIAWCKEAGVVKGYSDGTFKPANNITRQELAIMLRNYAAYCGEDVKADVTVLEAYPDASSVSGYAKEAMAWAVENGLISGSNGNLVPKGNATRGQTAKMILATYNLLNK